MTKEQLKEGKRLNREINSERLVLARQEFEIEMGGRRGGYDSNYLYGDEERKNDLFATERTKQRIAALEAKFAAL